MKKFCECLAQRLRDQEVINKFEKCGNLRTIIKWHQYITSVHKASVDYDPGYCGFRAFVEHWLSGDLLSSD